MTPDHTARRLAVARQLAEQFPGSWIRLAASLRPFDPVFYGALFCTAAGRTSVPWFSSKVEEWLWEGLSEADRRRIRWVLLRALANAVRTAQGRPSGCDGTVHGRVLHGLKREFLEDQLHESRP